MNSEEIARALSELETNLERLTALYNQYFLGIERTEPTIPRKAVDRQINMLRKQQIRNTALRFRLQMQIQKYNTQTTYWRKVCRQIEEGTYKRQIMLANRRQKERALNRQSRVPTRESIPASSSVPEQLIAAGEFEIDLDDPFGLDEPFKQNLNDATPPAELLASLDDPFSEGEKKTASPTKAKPEPKTPPKQQPAEPALQKIKQTTPKPTPKPTPSSPAHLDAAKARSIFRTYVAARAKCNEPTENLSLEKVTKSLEKKYVDKKGAVDFKVVIRNGKAAIKTIKK